MDASNDEPRKKRANGAGSIEVLPSGKARIAFRQNGKRRRKTFASEALAQQHLEALAALSADGAIEAPTGRTFGKVFDAFMTARELAGRVRGIDEENHLANARIRTAPFFDRPIRSIRRAELVVWVEDLLSSRALQGGRRPRQETDRTLSRETVGKALRLVRACFTWVLEREGDVDVNPAAHVRVPRHVREEDTSDPWTWLTTDEIERLLAADLSERDRALFTLAIFAGPRQGELFSLRWDDVHEADVDRPRVVFRRGRRGPTKGGKIRQVPLFTRPREALARWRELNGGDRVDGLVFPGPEGRAYGKKYNAGWPDKPQRIGKDRELVIAPGVKSRAGIVRDVRFHDLRHTCASHLVMGSWGAAWSLEMVREFLGHSTVRMTERYAHLGADSIHAKARETDALRLPTVAHEAPPEMPRSEEGSLVVPAGWAIEDLNLRLPPCESIAPPNDPASLPESWASHGPPNAPSTRSGLVRLLSAAAGEFAAAGDLHAARVAHEAVGRLLDAPAHDDRRAPVIELASERAKREG